MEVEHIQEKVWVLDRFSLSSDDPFLWKNRNRYYSQPDSWILVQNIISKPGMNILF